MFATSDGNHGDHSRTGSCSKTIVQNNYRRKLSTTELSQVVPLLTLAEASSDTVHNNRRSTATLCSKTLSQLVKETTAHGGNGCVCPAGPEWATGLLCIRQFTGS